MGGLRPVGFPALRQGKRPFVQAQFVGSFGPQLSPFSVSFDLLKSCRSLTIVVTSSVKSWNSVFARPKAARRDSAKAGRSIPLQ